jgi:hypothetical protein
MSTRFACFSCFFFVAPADALCLLLPQLSSVVVTSFISFPSVPGADDSLFPFRHGRLGFRCQHSRAFQVALFEPDAQLVQILLYVLFVLSLSFCFTLVVCLTAMPPKERDASLLTFGTAEKRTGKRRGFVWDKTRANRAVIFSDDCLTVKT